MKKMIALLTVLTPIFLFAQTTPKILKEGTLVKVVLSSDLNGKNVTVGQLINFEVSEDIMEGNRIIVNKGAKVTGTITEAQRSKALGKKGKLAFSIDYLNLPDGKIVRLRNQVQKNLNGSGALVGAGAVLFTPFALLIPGKNAKFEKGNAFTAYVDKEVEL